MTNSTVGAAWSGLGAVAPRALSDTRLQLHWATQVVATAGSTFVTPADDDSHSNLQWLANRGLLAGRRTDTKRSFRVAIDLAELTLHLLDAEGASANSFDLRGHTLEEGYAWLSSAAASYSGQSSRLKRPTYDLPRHAAAEGASFDPKPTMLAELARWYSNADLILGELLDAAPKVLPVRTWPHHFDIATILYLAPERSDAQIGVGMTPGDGSYDEPYWYVTPWPLPDHPALPPLEGGGHWHTDGWTGAVLTGTDLVAGDTPQSQLERVHAFLDSAQAGARTAIAAAT